MWQHLFKLLTEVQLLNTVGAGQSESVRAVVRNSCAFLVRNKLLFWVRKIKSSQKTGVHQEITGVQSVHQYGLKKNHCIGLHVMKVYIKNRNEDKLVDKFYFIIKEGAHSYNGE